MLKSLCTLFALAPLASAPLAAQDTRPNIVIVYSDDHAQAAIGAYGSTFGNTPHIDRLAAQGVRFTNSFVANAICGPARATLLTGLHSHANGKRTNGGGFRDDLPTFAKALQAAGYRTAMVGKWHLGPNPNGFDHWAIAKGGYYNPDFVTADGKTPQAGYTTDVITREALRWVAAGGEAGGDEEPFLVWISHDATHRTWMPSPRHLTRYDDVTIPEPATLFDDYAGRSPGAASAQMRVATDLFPAYDLHLPITGEGILDGAARGRLSRLTFAERATWDAAYNPKNAAFAAAELEGDDLTRWKFQRYMKDYLRCGDAVDDSVGEVLAFLDEKGLADNTVVIYASDQGFFLGEHGWYDKRWMYEPSFATPMIVRWPGVTEPGTTCAALVQNIDVAPTLVDLAGAQGFATHGASLVPLLAGEQPAGWRDGVYYHYHQQDAGRTSHMVARHYGVRTARYKLMYVYDHDTWELYDLERDPDEVVNLADDPEYAQVRAQLTQRLDELRADYGDDEDGFRPLFNGKDLDGWQHVNTAPSTWVVQDGMLHCTGKPTGELRTTRMYQNFIMEVEWRHMVPRGNAGIFVWADDITARGVPFHRSIEVQVLENAYGNTNSHTTHGDIFPIHGATMTPINGRGGSRAFPTQSLSKPSPEWNHYRITCIDGAISLAVNGELVTRGTDCSPRKGYICLESEGGVVDYRNLRILELPDSPVEAQHVAIGDRGYRTLYNGLDLDGWSAAEGWRSAGWVLAYGGPGGAPLSTEREFGDVGFLFDVRRKDDSGPLRVTVRGARLVIAPDDPFLGAHLVGGWNRIEGSLVGDELKVRVNDGPELRMVPPSGVAPRGPLRLEPQGPIDFANLFVRPLGK